MYGDNSEIVPTDQEIDPRETRSYWQKWIKAAKKGAEKHWIDAKQCWDEFELAANKELDVITDTSDRLGTYPIYYSSVKTLEPAYYSRTPLLSATRKFGIDDPIALTASVISERLARHLVDGCDFDSTMQACVADFIHADKTTLQLIYSADIGVDEYGQKIASNKRINLAPICYDEILHSPEAKSYQEVKEIAYFFCLDKDEALAKFEKLRTVNVQWKQGKSYEDKADNDSTDKPGQYLEGWEIWCEKTKKVYWYSEQFNEGLLNVQDNPYRLRRFFPSAPFAIGSKPSKSLYPTPTLIHMLGTVRQLHKGASKVLELTDNIKWAAIIDGSDPDLELALKRLRNGDYLAAKNFQAMIEKGGIANLVYFLPLKELVDAIVSLNSLEDRFEQQFYQWFGIPDILRGASDPIETAAAQEIKQTSAHDRFKSHKRMIAKLAEDGIEMMLDMAFHVFTPIEIGELVGLQYMQPQDKQNFEAAVQLLQNDKERLIRIELDTDSMSFSDQQLRHQRANTALDAVSKGLQAVSEMSQIDPQFAAVELQAVLASLETLQAGKQFTDSMQKAGEALLQKLQNPPEPPPPPPDYEKMKLEIAAQKTQIDAELKSRDLDIKQTSAIVESQKATAEVALERMRMDMEAQVQGIALQLETQRVQIEDYKAKLQAAESQMEEIRLAHEAESERMRAMIEAGSEETKEPQQAQAPQIINVQPPSIPPIHVNIEAARPGLKQVQVVRDEFGNATGYNISEGA